MVCCWCFGCFLPVLCLCVCLWCVCDYTCVHACVVEHTIPPIAHVSPHALPLSTGDHLPAPAESLPAGPLEQGGSRLSATLPPVRTRSTQQRQQTTSRQGSLGVGVGPTTAGSVVVPIANEASYPSRIMAAEEQVCVVGCCDGAYNGEHGGGGG